jgi:hypothetical protein
MTSVLAWAQSIGLTDRRNLAEKKPSDSSNWYNYVSKNFIYRLNWGIGSIVALAIDDVNNGKQSPDILPDELLNAATIREWAKSLSEREYQSYSVPLHMKVHLMRNFSGFPDNQWRVIPVEDGDEIYWFDPGGFHLASCHKPENWQASYMDTYDFTLVPRKKEVSSASYI